MRKFIKKALEKLDKLDSGQIHSLIFDIANENERLEAVLQSMPDGIIVSDTDYKTILVNKAAERFLDVHGTESLEHTIWESIPDKEIGAFVRETLLNEEKVMDKEFTVDTKGMQKQLYLSIVPLVKNGSIQGSLIHVNDVTEKKEREARLRRAESLASLTTLAAGVAHEIKNPLGSISIHIQLIQKVLGESNKTDKKTIRNNLEIISEEVNRLNSIVVDFLFAVRPMDIKLEERNINEVIIDVLELIEVEIKDSNIQFKSDLARNLPNLSIDEKYLKQALLNLIKNAIAAMPDGGTLSVKTELKGDHAAVQIKDTGCGIPDEILEKIFEPYFTTKDFGSGLGLTVVYKIVKEHFGDVSVSSKENEGTTFTLLFPIPQKELHLIGWQGDEDEV